jgi:hypothetical protein
VPSHDDSTPEAELDRCFAASQRLVGAERNTGDQVEEKDIARGRFYASLGFAEFIFSTVKDADPTKLSLNSRCYPTNSPPTKCK